MQVANCVLEGSPSESVGNSLPNKTHIVYNVQIYNIKDMYLYNEMANTAWTVNL